MFIPKKIGQASGIRIDDEMEAGFMWWLKRVVGRQKP